MRYMETEPFRPIYSILLEPEHRGSYIPTATSALSSLRIEFYETNRDLTGRTTSPHAQIYLFRHVEDALYAKRALERLHGVSRAWLSKLDGAGMPRPVAFTVDELELAAANGIRVLAPPRLI